MHCRRSETSSSSWKFYFAYLLFNRLTRRLLVLATLPMIVRWMITRRRTLRSSQLFPFAKHQSPEKPTRLLKRKQVAGKAMPGREKECQLDDQLLPYRVAARIDDWFFFARRLFRPFVLRRMAEPWRCWLLFVVDQWFSKNAKRFWENMAKWNVWDGTRSFDYFWVFGNDDSHQLHVDLVCEQNVFDK